MIVGTAGHIDHGKTALIQALTGINADRLPEEKKRGITIELGYASLQAPHGNLISFVDVPGHEKLVRTMVAGASGIDHALLLVAADDGIMPQTTEHAAILSLLGIRRGAVVLTKTDKVSADLQHQREQEVRAFLQTHHLDTFDWFAVSALRGDGIPELKDYLCQLAPQPRTRMARGQGFRMDLDRVFTLDGIGTVVAGSIVAGKVAVGDHLCLAHQPETTYRVRSLHSHHAAQTQAHAGQRCAIGLVGLERNHVERGMTLCDPAIALSTQRVDVWLQVNTHEEKPLRSGARVHLHTGTQDLIASVAVLGQTHIQPGEAALAQLVLEQPAHVWWGDRFVLRDAAARRTLGGGSVLAPLGLSRYRQTPERLAYLHTQRTPDPATRLQMALTCMPYGLQGNEWCRIGGWTAWPFDPAHLPDVVYAPKQEWLIASAQLIQHEQAVLAMLQRFHEQQAQDIGPDHKRARRLVAPRMPEVLWAHLLAHLVATQKIATRGNFIHLRAHGEQLRETERIVAQRALPLLLQGRFDPPWVRDIAGTARLSEAQVRTVLARLSKTGEVFQIVKDLYYHPKVVHELAHIARQLAQRDGHITAATYRDATGLGRKRAIQILEFFDRIAYLRRVGDLHLLRPGTPLFATEDVPS